MGVHRHKKPKYVYMSRGEKFETFVVWHKERQSLYYRVWYNLVWIKQILNYYTENSITKYIVYARREKLDDL